MPWQLLLFWIKIMIMIKILVKMSILTYGQEDNTTKQITDKKDNKVVIMLLIFSQHWSMWKSNSVVGVTQRIINKNPHTHANITHAVRWWMELRVEEEKLCPAVSGMSASSSDDLFSLSSCICNKEVLKKWRNHTGKKTSPKHLTFDINH